jgi:AAA domain
MSDRMWAAMQLADHPDVCAALAQGVAVPRQRLRGDVLARIGEATSGDDLVLTDELALRCEVHLNGAEADARGQRVRQSRQAYATPAARVKRERVDWLEHGRVPLGMVTVLAGVGGLGKSQWTCLLAARCDGVVLIATAEDSPEATVRPRLEAVRADLERVCFVTIRTDDDLEDGIRIPDDVAALEQLVEATEARLVIVDPLVAHLPASVDSNKDHSVRRALAPLYRLAKNYACAIVVVIHLNKAQGLAPLMRLAGSGAFGNAARSVLLLDRDPGDPDGEEGQRRVLAHIKCNVADLAPSLLYEVAPIVLPAVDGLPEVTTSRLELLGESEHNGRELLDLASEEERTAIEEAEEFLRVELGDGTRHRAEDIYKAARKIGISDRTLKRARTNLGAKTEKAGFERGWEWWLPEGAKEDEGATLLGLAPSGGLAPSQLVPGDSGYPDWIDQQFHEGHLTEAEWLPRRKLHADLAAAAT